MNNQKLIIYKNSENINELVFKLSKGILFVAFFVVIYQDTNNKKKVFNLIIRVEMILIKIILREVCRFRIMMIIIITRIHT